MVAKQLSFPEVNSLKLAMNSVEGLLFVEHFVNTADPLLYFETLSRSLVLNLLSSGLHIGQA